MSGECSGCGLQGGSHLPACPNGRKLTFEGVAKQSRAWAAERDELLRQERHHDMVCIVIDALVKDALIRGASLQLSAANHKAIAQQYADTIFPPPTETR